MRTITVAALAVPVLTGICWLDGCHSFSTVKESPDVVTQTRKIALAGNRIKGLVYYLPRGRIRISGDFKSGGDGGGPGDAAKSSVALAKAGGASGVDSAEQRNFVVTIAADIEADPSARYYLKPIRNYFYDDDIKLSVNAKHLLSTGNATAEDQTARIISTTAGLIAQVAAPGKAPPPALTEKEIPQEITLLELLREIEDAVSEGRVSIGDKTSVSSEAIKQRGNVLPGLYKPPPELSPDERQNIQAALAALYVKDTITVKNIRDLLRLYPSRSVNEPISLSKASVFRRQLQDTLNPEKPTKPKSIQPRPFSVVFDPAAHSMQIDQPYCVPVCDDPDGCGLKITITEKRQPELAKLKNVWEGTNRNTANGIVFRAVKPYLVKVNSLPGTWFYIRESRLVMLPDSRDEHTLVLDYSRLAFVKKTTNISFVDGIPQNFAQTAPSSVLGFLAIPKGIIQAIVPLPPAVTGPAGGLQGAGVSGTTGSPPPAPSSSITP